MVLKTLFRRPRTRIAGQALYACASRQARQPGFYRELGAADTTEGRFEIYSLHVALLILRLKGQGADAAETAQGLFDAYVRSLDDALREMGVGDVVVPKRMKKLGQAFYGRLQSYETALASLPDRAPLEALIARTALEGRASDATAALAGYAERAARRLADTALGELLEGQASWPELEP